MTPCGENVAQSKEKAEISGPSVSAPKKGKMTTGTYDIVEILGETLYGKGNVPVSTASVVASKPYIALYFSASWCPPCRVFTPKLIEFYGIKSSEVEVVLISHDHESTAHDEYFAKMPWLHLPYEQRDRKTQLVQLFKVKGIPSLRLLRSDGSGIQAHDARSLIEKDVQGNHFPYNPKTIRSALADASLYGTSTNKNELTGKTIAIYFESPNPESTAVQTALLEAYNDAKSTGHADDFEVLLVSWAKTKEEYEAHVAAFPYVKVDFDEKFTTAFHLSNLYNVHYNTTHIIVLNPERELINNDAGTAVKKVFQVFLFSSNLKYYLQGSKYPFNALKVVDLSESQISNNFSLYQKASLLAITKTPTAASHAHSVLTLLAEKYSPTPATAPVCTDEFCDPDLTKTPEPDIIFFTATNDGNEDGLIAYLRKQVGLPDEAEAEVEVILYDWFNGRVVYRFDGEFGVDGVSQFVDDFKSGNLVKKV
ncbi:hypothetical protein HK100_008484 [Physocladia obscura]|uniref:Thioredoxin domain-containing protein n=1 Tax=Physocladia obscura TaxID=109957 RepID=A0AAD5XA53_9FUNG|nr:hypothetical protein HK100_008484 [Physocladia obscura]